MCNHNCPIYTVVSGASAAEDLKSMGVAEVDVPNTKLIPYAPATTYVPTPPAALCDDPPCNPMCACRYGFNAKDEPFMPMSAFNPYSPDAGEKAYQDLTGRFACPRPALLVAIAKLFVNDGEYNGRQLISTQLIRLSKEPQLPPGYDMKAQNSKGGPLSPQAPGIVWGAGSVLTHPFAWLTRDVNVDMMDANLSTWRDLGVNAAAVSVKFSGVITISCLNAWPFVRVPCALLCLVEPRHRHTAPHTHTHTL
jgi:hypothetical protein